MCSLKDEKHLILHAQPAPRFQLNAAVLLKENEMGQHAISHSNKMLFCDKL